ncbi:hypothetical protein [Natroniella sp. ANB-PHB2]|uniref:hypothetical protein n=1 Tax=Natroniella sp. ANB-PHB2 TaxID=3384444 RepID=UPI0038D368EB
MNEKKLEKFLLVTYQISQNGIVKFSQIEEQGYSKKEIFRIIEKCIARNLIQAVHETDEIFLDQRFTFTYKGRFYLNALLGNEELSLVNTEKPLNCIDTYGNVEKICLGLYGYVERKKVD